MSLSSLSPTEMKIEENPPGNFSEALIPGYLPHPPTTYPPLPPTMYPPAPLPPNAPYNPYPPHALWSHPGEFFYFLFLSFVFIFKFKIFFYETGYSNPYQHMYGTFYPPPPIGIDGFGMNNGEIHQGFEQPYNSQTEYAQKSYAHNYIDVSEFLFT